MWRFLLEDLGTGPGRDIVRVVSLLLQFHKARSRGKLTGQYGLITPQEEEKCSGSIELVSATQCLHNL